MTAFIQFLADESVGLQHQAVASVRLGRLARGQGAGNGCSGGFINMMHFNMEYAR